MTVCIFCQKPLIGRETSEHVLLNAFGGKVKTRRLSCAPCNNTFGNTIDRELAEQFASVRNMFEMVSGDGRDAPSLRKVQVGDRKVNLLGNGDITLAGKPFSVEETGDGQFRVEIKVRSLDELEKIIPYIIARTGISEARLREQLAGAQFTDTQERPGTIDFRFSFGGEEVIRAVAKACLLLWGRKLGNEEVQRPEYDDIRLFVQNGGADFLSASTDLDTRPLPIARAVEAEYGPLFHMLYVTSDDSGRVVGHFTVYNLIGFQVVLAVGGANPGQTAYLASNPLDPRIWSDKVSPALYLGADWLETPSFEIDEYRNRFVAMMESYYRIMGARAVVRIADRVFSRYGLGKDDPIPPEMLKPIYDEIITRIAHNISGIPMTVPVSPEVIKERLRQPLEEFPPEGSHPPGLRT